MTIRTAFLEARWLWGDEQAVRPRHAPLPQGSRRRHRRRIRRRQARRARRAPHQDGRQPLCRRAQRQGRQGRAARPPHALLDRQICPRRRAARRPGRRRAADRRRVPPLRSRRALLLVGPLPSAPARRPRRGAAQFRLSAAHRRDHALCRPAGEIGGRAVHAILFPQREDGRRPDRRVPRPARRAAGQEGLPLRACRRSAAGPSGSPASCSTAGGSRIPADDFFRADPVRLLELFALAAREQLEIHPTRDARRDPRRRADRPRTSATIRAPTPCSWKC